MFSKLFGNEPKRDIAALAKPLCAPAVHLVKTVQPTRSFVGGRPSSMDGLTWPSFNNRPLDFIAQIDLEDLQTALAHYWLPTTGTLLFFYDMEAGTWGFDPKDRGSAAVVHTTWRANSGKVEAGESRGEAIRAAGVEFRRIETLPSGERKAVAALNLTDKEFDEWFDLGYAQFRGEPRHQIGGYPDCVQGDSMELECALTTNGLYCGDPSGFHDPRGKALKATALEWKLLLQIDTDEALDVMWGDSGKIYYWVREGEARVGNFSNAWMILQCG